MADVVIKGVYATKTALDTAHPSGNTNGDTYIVGSKCPYDLYSWSGSAFTKGAKCGTIETLTVTLDDVNQDITLANLMTKTLKDAGGNNVKLAQAIGKRDLGQLDVIGA